MNSKSTINLVIGFLGLIGLTVVIGGFVLAYDNKAIPDALIALGAGAVGGIGGILSKTGTEPMPVTVGPPPAPEAVIPPGLEGALADITELIKRNTLPAEPDALEGGALVAELADDEELEPAP